MGPELECVQVGDGWEASTIGADGPMGVPIVTLKGHPPFDPPTATGPSPPCPRPLRIFPPSICSPAPPDLAAHYTAFAEAIRANLSREDLDCCYIYGCVPWSVTAPCISDVIIAACMCLCTCGLVCRADALHVTVGTPVPFCHGAHPNTFFGSEDARAAAEATWVAALRRYS